MDFNIQDLNGYDLLAMWLLGYFLYALVKSGFRISTGIYRKIQYHTYDGVCILDTEVPTVEWFREEYQKANGKACSLSYARDVLESHQLVTDALKLAEQKTVKRKFFDFSMTKSA